MALVFLSNIHWSPILYRLFVSLFQLAALMVIRFSGSKLTDEKKENEIIQDWVRRVKFSKNAPQAVYAPRFKNFWITNDFDLEAMNKALGRNIKKGKESRGRVQLPNKQSKTFF